MEPPGLAPSRFRSPPGILPECGSVLPRPGPPSSLPCPRCGFRLLCSDLQGCSVRSSLSFNGPGGGRGGSGPAPPGGTHGGQELPQVLPCGDVVPHPADALG
ncbi:DNA-directed RNA polymerase I subunit RPA12 [Agelaius tricolor]|uniref:DNA-directed RNA polymerase I subunit RPA12 n=1 Tax=Agelaius tricolor TaxID=9191 RepID=UPI0039F1C20F